MAIFTAETRFNIHRLELTLARLALFLIPIKLSFAYSALLPFLALWIFHRRHHLVGIFLSVPSAMWRPIVVFAALATFLSVFSIDPGNAAYRSLKLFPLIMIIPAYFEISKRGETVSLMISLLLGLLIASMQTIFMPSLPAFFSELSVGEVTEAGQLCIGVIICLGSIFIQDEKKLPRIGKVIFLILATPTYIWLGFGGGLPALTITFCMIIISTNFYAKYKRLSDIKAHLQMYALLALPFIIAALVVNLKRGPWLGAIVGSFLLFCSIGKRSLAGLILIISALILTLTPVKERVMDSYQHFALAGGRKSMWVVGMELAAKFPLGIGFGNSRFMQQLDPEIPDTHRHFHNNLLNILVETGWFGLLVFLVWIVSIIKFGFRDIPNWQDRIVARSISACIVAWQVAGLVEYNYGDSEILIIVLALLGILGATSSSHSAAT